jgi:hypothetical protein
MSRDIMNVVLSCSLKEACDLIQNIDVGYSSGIVEAWGVDKCAAAAIGCCPIMVTDLRGLGRDTMSDFRSLVTGDELDKLFVE